ncbi:MAG: helix-turn-helix domain-containing protein [Methylocella sp.]
MAQQIETLLTPVQAAEILQVKPNTLAKWRVTGEGPAFVHIGRAVRYHPRELARYIEHQTRRSTSEASTGGGRGYHNNDPL